MSGRVIDGDLAADRDRIRGLEAQRDEVERMMLDQQQELVRLRAQLADAFDFAGGEAARAAHASTQAALGRAVAALQEARFDVSWERTPESIALSSRINAILADPTSAAAGEYVKALEDTVKHAREIRRLQKRGLLSPVTEEAFDEAVAKVDARRDA